LLGAHLGPAARDGEPVDQRVGTDRDARHEGDRPDGRPYRQDLGPLRPQRAGQFGPAGVGGQRAGERERGHHASVEVEVEVEVGWAGTVVWNSTLSRVSSMKASSSEACTGASSRSRTALSKART